MSKRVARRSAPKKHAPKKTPLRQALAVARARVKQAREDIALATEIAGKITAPVVGVSGAPDRFVSLCAVRVGYASILHALDVNGQVWQRQHKLNNWAPLTMTRGELVPYEKAPKE